MKPFIFALGLAAAGSQALEVSDSAIGYSLTLPVHWGVIKSKPLQNYFRDSTRSYKSQISILRYVIDKSGYPTPQSWAQAQFIAYKVSVETSVFPYGAVTYYDSSATAKIGTVWAPEAYSVLYPADGDPTYSEFIRYCAVGDFGYEIYAIGDSTDMINHVDFYAGVIATLKFTTPSPDRVLTRPKASSLAPAGWYFDAAGRFRPANRLRQRHAAWLQSR